MNQHKDKTITVILSVISTVIIVSVLEYFFNLAEDGLLITFNTLIAVCVTLGVIDVRNKNKP